MSEIKSLEKLHEIAYEMRNIGASSMTPRELFAFWAMDIEKAAGEIQVEIDSRYMELPIDADGVPIHVGDTLELHGQYEEEGQYEVDGLTYYGDCWYFSDGAGHHFNTFGWSHVKPRTIVDVLHDCCNEWNQHLGKDWEQGVYAKYADEIRELLGSDAE